MTIAEVLLKHGKITQEQYDKHMAKEQKRTEAKERIKKKQIKDMKKDELIDIIEKLTGTENET